MAAIRPADLGQRLEARGWVSDPGATWMTASLAAFAGAPPTPDGFTVQQVADDAMLEEWKWLSSAGFEMDVQIYYDAYARHGYGPAARSLSPPHLPSAGAGTAGRSPHLPCKRL